MSGSFNSSGCEDVIKVVSYDGQVVWAENRVPLYEVGNFLGGGAAGTVYEAENVKSKERYALKILNPIGYKLLSPALIRRCTILSKGKPLSEQSERGKEALSKDHVWWLLNGSTKQYLAAYYSERQRSLNELSLLQCIQIWGSNPHHEGSLDASPGRNSNLPIIPPKYIEFVKKRDRIFREINNMRKISPHTNVIRLEHVLELAQDSKCTIFLVMELANGGELFDRIKIDCGTREKTAKKFFLQLLAGVCHCHQEGVCHRDLKPENLLLQDFSSAPDCSILKIADFGFSARVVLGAEDLVGDGGIGSTPHHTMTPAILRSVVGSPFYVAPEVLQAQAQGYDGLKADAWSLGVILYAMLAGNLPFSQELSTCKRFKQFGIWAAEQSSKSLRFWDDPNLVYPPWLFSSKFSPLARSLIVAFLLPDPNARISVQESQKHPWCQIDDEDTPQSMNAFRSNPGLFSPTASVTVSSEFPIPPPIITNDSLSYSRSNSKTNTPSNASNVKDSTQNESMVVVSPSKIQNSPLNSPSYSAPSTGHQGASIGIYPQIKSAHKGQNFDEPFVMDESDDDGMELEEAYGSAQIQRKGDDCDASKSVLGRDRLSPITEKSPNQSDSPPLNLPSYSSFMNHVQSNGKSDIILGNNPTKNFFPDQPKQRMSSPIPTPNMKEYNGPQHRRSFTTPPPVPVDEVPYIVAGTPDLISSLVYGPSVMDGTRSHSSSLDIESTLIGAIPPLHRGTTTGSMITSGHNHPPSFHDTVKRSTRFITSVPAHEVLQTVEAILEQCRLQKTMSPIGLIGRVEVHWDNYRVEVWGIESLQSSPPLCSLHLYQLPSSTPPQSPARDFSSLSSAITPSQSNYQRYMHMSTSPIPSYGYLAQPFQQTMTSNNLSSGTPLYLVEFVRGQLEIFPFKRFYEWVRQRISELVKKDYAFSLLDQAGSPIRPSILSESPRSSRYPYHPNISS